MFRHAVIPRRAVLTGLLVALVGAPARAAPPSATPPRLGGIIASELQGAAHWAKSAHARLGACFVDLESGSELGGVAAGVAENPASNEKLVTVGTLLAHLGPAHTFATELRGVVAEGRVSELAIHGEGDPSLTSADLAAMVDALRARGVTRVGKLVVDQSAFDEHFVPPGFDQQPNEWAAFRAPVSAVAVDENTVLVAIEPTESGSPARVSFEPESFVEVEGEIGTGPRGKPQRALAGLTARDDHLLAHLGGSVAEGSEPLRYRRRVDDPRLLAGYVLRSALVRSGVALESGIELGTSEAPVLVEHRSRPLAELLPELGKNSDNFYAETLLKALAGESSGRPASSDAGAALALAWLEQIGAADAGTRVTNGSGLFDTNRLSPRTLTAVLLHVWRDPNVAPVFVHQLAVGGVDGTLRSRFASQAVRRSVVAKTGTLSDVVALSGYVLAPGRDRGVAFSFLVNHVRGHLASARQHIDRVVNRVADELWAEAAASATSG